MRELASAATLSVVTFPGWRPGGVLKVEGSMYRVWYWAVIDRESDGRFITSIPDLEDLAAYGHTDKDAVAHVTELASQRVRAAVEGGQPVPPAATELRNAEPDPVQGSRTGNHPGGSRAPGGVADAALSHVLLSPAAGNGNALFREKWAGAPQSKFGPAWWRSSRCIGAQACR
jgi:predicted RNase H-like HicB family nuclease